MPNKIGLHAFHVNLYLHEFFELSLFFSPWTIVDGLKGKFWPFLKSGISESGAATPTKIGVHA